MGTIPIVGASSFLGMHGWREEEGGWMDVIERQTRLAELLSSMLLEGIIFPEAEEVMGVAEEMEKEEVDFKGMSGEMNKCIFDLRIAMHRLKEAGRMRGIKGRRREVGREDYEKVLEEKRRVEEEKKRVEERMKTVEEENIRLKDEKKKAEEEKKKKAEEEETKNDGVILPPITSLSSLSLTFSNPIRMKRENNMIIHQGYVEWESCLIGDVLRTVSLLFFLFSLCISLSSHPGNLSNVSLYCSVSPFLSLSFIAHSRYIAHGSVSLHSFFISLHLFSPSYSVLPVCDGSKECPKSGSTCSELGSGIFLSLIPSLLSSLLSPGIEYLPCFSRMIFFSTTPFSLLFPSQLHVWITQTIIEYSLQTKQKKERK